MWWKDISDGPTSPDIDNLFFAYPSTNTGLNHFPAQSTEADAKSFTENRPTDPS